MGLPAGSAEAATDYQFSLRGALSGRPMSRASVILLRVHRIEIAQVEVEVHESRRALVLLRWPMASDA